MKSYKVLSLPEKIRTFHLCSADSFTASSDSCCQEISCLLLGTKTGFPGSRYFIATFSVKGVASWCFYFNSLS